MTDAPTIDITPVNTPTDTPDVSMEQPNTLLQIESLAMPIAKEAASQKKELIDDLLMLREIYDAYSEILTIRNSTFIVFRFTTEEALAKTKALDQVTKDYQSWSNHEEWLKNRTLYISGAPHDVTDKDIIKLLEPTGPRLRHIHIPSKSKSDSTSNNNMSRPTVEITVKTVEHANILKNIKWRVLKDKMIFMNTTKESENRVWAVTGFPKNYKEFDIYTGVKNLCIPVFEQGGDGLGCGPDKGEPIQLMGRVDYGNGEALFEGHQLSSEVSLKLKTS